MKKLSINKSDLINNINKIKSFTDATVIATLKNNGYGLGLNEYPVLLLENGIDFFAVSTVDEAVTLRNNGFTNRIMLLHSTFLDEDIKLMIDNDIILTVGSFETLEKIHNITDMNVNVQLKIDTGFGRFGFLPSELKELSEKLKCYANIHVIGTFSHFSMSFNKNKKYTQKQYDTFLSCVKELNELSINTGILHVCNSSAFLQYKDMHLDAVRVGSAFLGRILVPNDLSLIKVGTLISKIEYVKSLPAKHFIGYSNTYSTTSETQTAVVPVGYLDGFGLKKALDCFRLKDILREMYNDFLLLNKKKYVKIDNKKVPVLGKIGTNNIVIQINKEIDISSDVICDINPMLVKPDIQREFI